ncbi:putative endonuclease-reverse transcriptase [Trichonephila clavipes]|nr:putative endonuclease-reverse transcriptase [Trichonephila clavipes]
MVTLKKINVILQEELIRIGTNEDLQVTKFLQVSSGNEDLQVEDLQVSRGSSVLTYASETLPLTLRDEEALGIFKRKIVRNILGGIQENASCREEDLSRRSREELYKICKQPDIEKFVILQRLKWAGHLARMNEDHCCKKIFLAKPMGNRPRGRPQ